MADLQFIPHTKRPALTHPKPVEVGVPDETEMTWRDLALQFDGHRIEALSVIRGLIDAMTTFQATSLINARKNAQEFLVKPPMSGEAVLAHRIAEMRGPRPLDLSEMDADDEAIEWVSRNLHGLRHDSGTIEYTLSSVVRAYQSGRSTLTDTAKGVEVTDAMVERACKSTDPLLFSGDPQTEHMAASPYKVEHVKDLLRTKMRAALTASLSEVG